MKPLDQLASDRFDHERDPQLLRRRPNQFHRLDRNSSCVESTLMTCRMWRAGQYISCRVSLSSELKRNRGDAVPNGFLWANYHYIELRPGRNITACNYPSPGGAGAEARTSGISQIQIRIGVGI